MTTNYDKARMLVNTMFTAVRIGSSELIKQTYNDYEQNKHVFNGLDYLIQTWNHLMRKANETLEKDTQDSNLI